MRSYATKGRTNRTATAGQVVLATAAVVWAASMSLASCGEGFSDDESTGGTAGTAGSGGTGASAGTGGNAGHAGAGGTGGTGAGGSGGGNGGGGAEPCSHDVCVQGDALLDGCSDCVTAVCDEDWYCCDTRWDAWCVWRTDWLCTTPCSEKPDSCAEQYGRAPGFLDCPLLQLCSFEADIDTLSCHEICGEYGGRCLGADIANPVNECTPLEVPDAGAPHTCGSKSATKAICWCTLGCNGSAPCPPGQICHEGSGCS